METQEEISLTIDPSRDRVIGVMKNKVYIQTEMYHPETDEPETIVVVTSEREYLKMWKNWLAGKRGYCERYNYFCGAMGEFYAEEFKELEPTVWLNEWVDDGTDEGKDIQIRPRLFKVTKFDEDPQFEHG